MSIEKINTANNQLETAPDQRTLEMTADQIKYITEQSEHAYSDQEGVVTCVRMRPIGSDGNESVSYLTFFNEGDHPLVDTSPVACITRFSKNFNDWADSIPTDYIIFNSPDGLRLVKYIDVTVENAMNTTINDHLRMVSRLWQGMSEARREVKNVAERLKELTVNSRVQNLILTEPSVSKEEFDKIREVLSGTSR